MKQTPPRGFSGGFSVFGFPTRIRPGFGIFLLLLTIIYPAPLGLWVALAMGVFTLVHELGHAFAARRAGCTASISLDFMVAYASYSSNNELNWRAKSLITISGPALQIGSALLVLASAGVNPMSRNDITSSSFAASVWWSGIALGLLNLVPLLPLDGGALVATIAEHFAPGKGRNAVLYLSFGITIGITGLTLYIDAIGLMPLFIFMLMMQWQQIAAPRRMKLLIENAELQATGDPRLDGAIIDSLLTAQETERALQFAKEAYRLCPAFSNAYVCAVLSLQCGKNDDAATWVAAAYRSQIKPNELTTALASRPEWELLRGHPGISDEWFTRS
jgi:Zn-dependent protease